MKTECLRRIVRLVTALAFCALAKSPPIAFAQGPGNGFKPPKTTAPLPPSKTKTTIIEIKLLAGGDGASLHSQHWLKLLEPMDVSIQIQKPTLDDKLEIKEREVGTLRYVTAIGKLDRSGTITFPNKAFSTSDGASLKEWINELKAYGAQGSPEGQPLWGLSKEQFNRLYESLNRLVELSLINEPLREATTRIPLPEQAPLRWSKAALDTFRAEETPKTVRQEVQGFSAATALAIMLNGSRLGFRPSRTPTGGMELVVEPLGIRDDHWPVGWPLQQERLKAAPKYVALSIVELDQVALSDVLTAASELTETPILIDYAELDAKKIDLSTLKVSYKRRRTSWSVATKELVIPHKLSRELWQDEAGRTFVWITTNRPGGRSALSKD